MLAADAARRGDPHLRRQRSLRAPLCERAPAARGDADEARSAARLRDLPARPVDAKVHARVINILSRLLSRVNKGTATAGQRDRSPIG